MVNQMTKQYGYLDMLAQNANSPQEQLFFSLVYIVIYAQNVTRIRQIKTRANTKTATKKLQSI